MIDITKVLPQFDRNRHGSLYDRGASDAWYHRPIDPHWYPDGTYNGKRIDTLTDMEIEEYMEGYNFYMNNNLHKDYT